MNVKDIRKLINSGKTSLVLHGLHQWEQHANHLPDILIDAIKSDNVEILKFVLQLARKYHPKVCAPFIQKLLLDGNTDIKRLTIQYITIDMGSKFVETVKTILSKEKDVYILASAVVTAAKIGVDSKAVIPFLKHQDIRLRANATRAVAELAPANLRNLLEPLLKDKSLRVQNEAIKGLAKLISEKDLEALIRKRLSANDSKIRAATAYITGELPINNAQALLVNILRDRDSSVSVCAVRSLMGMKSATAWREIIDIFFKTKNEDLINILLNNAENVPARLFLNIAEEYKKTDQEYSEVAKSVLKFASRLEDWEPFLHWVMINISNENLINRRIALEFVYKNISYFRTDIDSLLKKAKKYSTPDDLAMIYLIQWKSGNALGLDKIKKILAIGEVESVLACIRALKLDNSLISRQMIEEAAEKGYSDTEIVVTKPAKKIKLPKI